MRASIEKTLRARFAIKKLIIEDVSHHHIGHAGHDGHGESHFNVTIISDDFANLSRVQRHQAVYKALNEQLASKIHALSLSTLTVSESES